MIPHWIHPTLEAIGLLAVLVVVGVGLALGLSFVASEEEARQLAQRDDV